MWIERAVRPHRTVRNKRQHHKGRACEDQDVVQLPFCKNRADKAVEPGPPGEQSSHDDGDGTCQRRLLRREATQENGQHQRDLGRQAGVVVVAAPIGDRHQGNDARGDNGERYPRSDHEADGAGERGNSEGSYPCGRTRRSFALAAFSLGADQQANPKRHDEIEHHGCGDGEVLPCGAECAKRACCSRLQF